MNEIIQNLEANVTNSQENFCYISENKLNAIKELSKREYQEKENLQKQNTELKEENKRLKQWDCNKDSRNSSQRTTNAELHKKIYMLNKRWDKLKEWLEEEKPTDDMNENFIVIRLSDIKNKMKDLELNDE